MISFSFPNYPYDIGTMTSHLYCTDKEMEAQRD